MLNISFTNLDASIYIHTMHAWFTFLSLNLMTTAWLKYLIKVLVNTRLTRRVTSYTIQHICILQIHFKVIFFNNGYIFVLKIHNLCSNFPISSYVEILVISTKCENTDKQKQQQKSLLKKLYLLRNTSFVFCYTFVSQQMYYSR